MAEVALLVGLPVHAETSGKAAVSSFQEASQEGANELKTLEGEESLVSFLKKLASFLVVLPGHPEHGPLHVLNGVVRAVTSHTWLPPGLQKSAVLSSLLLTCGALATNERPGGVDIRGPYVDDNDPFLKEAIRHKEEIKAMANNLAREAMDCIRNAPFSEIRRRHSLNLCDVITLTFQEDEERNKFCATLQKLATDKSFK